MFSDHITVALCIALTTLLEGQVSYLFRPEVLTVQYIYGLSVINSFRSHIESIVSAESYG